MIPGNKMVDYPMSQEFGRNVERVLYGKGLSKTQLARRINVAPSTICGYINGHRPWPLDKAVATADWLAKDVYTLAGRETCEDK